MKKGVRIILVKTASGKNYSIEAGIIDEKNFDHHGKFSDYLAPCADRNILLVLGKFVIEITHLDADTFVGILRLLGLLEKVDQDLVDLSLMGEIDTNGSSILPNHGRDNTTRQYMVGISQVARKIKFPRWKSGDIDVTEILERMLLYSTEEIIRIGRKKIIQGEKAYLRCKDRAAVTDGKAIFLCIERPEDSFDGNLPFEDSYKAVVIYSRRRESISLRIHPDVNLKVSDKEFAGVPFAGHAKAAGSLRDKKFTKEQAENVRMVLEYLLRTA